MTIYTLSHGSLKLDVSDQGGVIEGFWRDTTPLLRPGKKSGVATDASCFPLVPFANRVSGNRFVWQGREYQLQPNVEWDAHYLHGDGWLGEWQCVSHSDDSLCLVYEHRSGVYHYRVSQAFHLTADTLTVTLSVTNQGAETLPFGTGWHPYFPLSPQTRIQAQASGYWLEREQWLAGEFCEQLPQELDFNQPAPLPRQWVNNGFAGWNGQARIEQPQEGYAIIMETTPPAPCYFFALPKGSVSRQIQALEHQLGTQLLQRTTRRVKLTPEGMTYYQRAKDVLSNLSELDGLFQQDATSISGKLRIDIPPGIAKSLLLPRLSEFLYLHPGIELELSSHDRPVDILHDGFDCVIRTGALPEDGVIARPLGKLTMVNCASPHYLTRFGYPQSPDDLTSHAIVRYTPHLGVHPLGFEVASVNGVQWFKSGGMLTVNSSENYLTAGLAGLGIIQIPRIAVREALRAGRLIEVLPGYRAEPLSLSLVYPQRRELSRRVNLFMQWLAGVMKEYLD